MKNILYIICLLVIYNLSSLAGGFIICFPETDEHIKRRPPTDIMIWPPRPIPVPPPSFRNYPLEIKSEKVMVTIAEQVAQTKIEQVFHNPFNHRLEGYFMFPVPQNISIDQFTMEINGKAVQAEMLEAEKARSIYENIVRSMRDPALLEYSRQDLFKVRIFPIEAKEDKKITIRYSELLCQEDHITEYVYPLKHEKTAGKNIGTFKLDIAIEQQEAIKLLYSPTHEIDSKRTNPFIANIGYKAENLSPDTDFKLYLHTLADEIGLSLLTYREEGETGFFMLDISPGIQEAGNNQQGQTIAKDITFVIDISGSMEGEKMDKAKEALSYCVNNLHPKDRFSLVRFSTEAKTFREELTEANEKNIKEAMKFIKELRPVGGTNIDEGLEKALAFKSNKDRPYFIVFITDGKPTIGITDENDLLKKIKDNNRDNIRIFTFGIGEEINTHLLDKITEESRAYRSYILPEEDIAMKISNFYTKISAPVLTDLYIENSKNVELFDIYPKQIPDIFKGSSLMVFGKYKGRGEAKITLSGKVNGVKKTYTRVFDFSKNKTNYDFIPPLWATRSVGYLLDQIRLHGEDKELVSEVVRLAKEYGIITPYTSYLIMEEEEINRTRPPVMRPGQTPPLPEPRQPIIFDTEEIKAEQHKIVQEDYDAMNAKSGRSSVRSSKEIQSLNYATNKAHSKAGQSRMYSYQSKNNTELKQEQLYTNIQGRAVYQTAANNWIDTAVAKNAGKTKEQKRIQFASKEYFDLLNNEPDTASFLALSNNVTFFYKNVVYEIYE